ncbi:MAG TPA: dihydropteroate synthase [Chitinophagaceae bacterium]|nr:dihydropteroate synthase [Chitinophagaceae bacterium]
MFTLNCKGRLLVIDKPIVMGIINTTPDSFFADSRKVSADAVVKQAAAMLEEGAAIIDIGGQSTRPGSLPVSEEEELSRVISGIEVIHRRFPECIISVDTYYARVAKEAVGAGASMVNDISAGTLDPGMIQTVASLHVPYVLMHIQGTPQTMQQSPHYDNVTREVLDFFSNKLPALRQAGIADIIIDPGFGFGKTHAHNFQLLRELPVFSMLGKPLLAGLSRKGTIYKTLNITAEESLNGTTVLNTVAIMKGANILRVHDVKAAVQAITLLRTMQ